MLMAQMARAARRILGGGKWCVAACVCGSVLTGCLDSTDPSAVKPSVAASTAAEQRVTADTGDFDAKEAFSIVTTAPDKIAFGQPFQVTARVTSSIRSARTTVRIDAPEIVTASRSAWNHNYRMQKGEVPSIRTESRAVQNGDAFEARAALTIRAAGYYRVAVSVSADSIGPEVNRSQTQGSVMRELWLRVDSDGSITTTSTFEPERVPRGMMLQPGPWRSARGLFKPDTKTAAPVQQMSEGDGYDHFTLLYFDQEANQLLPLPGATVQITYWRETLGTDEIIGYDQAGTGEDGGFFVNCDQLAASGEWYTATIVQLSSPYVKIANIGFYGAVGGAGGSQCSSWAGPSTPYVFGGYSDASRVFMLLHRGIPLAQAILGKSRPQIRVNVNAQTGSSAYSPSILGFGDVINIYSNAVQFEYGRFTAIHEYGHALWEKGMGGNGAGSQCPSPHRWNGAYNLKCAISEGWASYVAVVTGYNNIVRNGITYTDEVFPYSTTDLSRGCIYFNPNNSCVFFQTNADGSVTEGAVTQAMMNLTDAANGSHDQVQLPPSYLADLIANCYLTPFPNVRVDGVDHLVYCLERTVDPAIRNVYFGTRATKPTSLLSVPPNTPPGWRIAGIRQVWKWDLYHQ
jgi:hypothetical protein